MFCGLPLIKVAAEPALVEAASAIAKGRGSNPRARAPTISSGAMVMIRMSLASTAARPAPPTATVNANSTVVPCRVLVKVRAQRSMNPDLGELPPEMIIIANKSASVGMSTLVPEIVESVICRVTQERDDGEQRDPGAIDLQPGDPPGRHAGVGQNQDEQDDRGVHRAARGKTRSPSWPRRWEKRQDWFDLQRFSSLSCGCGDDGHPGYFECGVACAASAPRSCYMMK